MSQATFPDYGAGHDEDVNRRIEWIDLVKAVSVLLVVFMHASNTLVDLAGPGWVPTVLQVFNHLVEPLRMPIFFLVSGMLASSAIRRPWSASTGRTSGMLYLYVVWMLLYFSFTGLFGDAPADPIGSILLAKSGYWYLYAMAIFFVIARLLRNQPAWLVVAVALVPNMLRPQTEQILGGLIPGTLFTSMAMNLGFFLAGAYFKDLVGGLAQKVTTGHAVLLGLLAAGTGVLWLRTPQLTGQSLLPLSIVWVAFGVSVAVLITRDGAPQWARYVGARTLSVYVLQWPVLFLVGTYLPGSALTSSLLQLAMPLAVTAVVTGLALGLHSVGALRPLFTAPRWVTHPQELRVPDRVARHVADTEPAAVTAGR